MTRMGTVICGSRQPPLPRCHNHPASRLVAPKPYDGGKAGNRRRILSSMRRR
jgi:hypothetical protein